MMTTRSMTKKIATARDDEDEVESIKVDDVDAPNIYPYKKCSECGDRKSCGNYNEDKLWFCEDCDDFTIRNVGECGRCGEDNNKGGTELWNDLCKKCDKIETPV